MEEKKVEFRGFCPVCGFRDPSVEKTEEVKGVGGVWKYFTTMCLNCKEVFVWEFNAIGALLSVVRGD